MKYYAQITGVFVFLTMGVTFWMSHELGLLSFRNGEAAEAKSGEGKPAETKTEDAKKSEAKEDESKTAASPAPVAENQGLGENDSVAKSEAPIEAKKDVEKPSDKTIDAESKKKEAEEWRRIEVASNSAPKEREGAKIEAPAQPEVLGPIDEREAALETREKLLKDKEQILREQSEHYEKVLMELRQRVGSQTKENKNITAQKEIECSTKLKKQEGDYKLQLLKKESELKSKSSLKESELRAILSKRENELKVVQKELSTLKDSRADAFKTMYEKMDAKKAAKIMNEMDLELAHKILSSIKQDHAAEILAHMTTEKARHVTEKALPNRATASVKP